MPLKWRCLRCKFVRFRTHGRGKRIACTIIRTFMPCADCIPAIRRTPVSDNRSRRFHRLPPAPIPGTARERGGAPAPRDAAAGVARRAADGHRGAAGHGRGAARPAAAAGGRVAGGGDQQRLEPRPLRNRGRGAAGDGPRRRGARRQPGGRRAAGGERPRAAGQAAGRVRAPGRAAGLPHAPAAPGQGRPGGALRPADAAADGRAGDGGGVGVSVPAPGRRPGAALDAARRDVARQAEAGAGQAARGHLRALRALPVATVLLDLDGTVALWNARGGAAAGLHRGGGGRPFRPRLGRGGRARAGGGALHGGGRGARARGRHGPRPRRAGARRWRWARPGWWTRAASRGARC